MTKKLPENDNFRASPRHLLPQHLLLLPAEPKHGDGPQQSKGGYGGKSNN
jgi:hypothetical protein